MGTALPLLGGAGFAALLGQHAVALRPPVAEKLPDLAHFQDHVEVEIGHQYLVLVPTGLGDDLAAGIAKITLAVELANAPGLFFANPVNGANEIAVGHGMSWLF